MHFTLRFAPLMAVATGLACRAPAATENTSGTVQSAQCPPWASGSRCGVFVVPEDPTAANGRTVSLAFIVLPALTAAPAPDPVVYVAGGPGQTITEIARTFDVTELRSTRDVVFIDQRGTSISPRLDCPSNSQDPRVAIATLFDVAFMTACRDELQRIADLRQYTTMRTVADLEAFRAALGYPRVNLIGASYGTRVILRYLQQAPAAVRSAVLTSAVPPAFRNPLYHAQSAQLALDTLIAWCDAEPACRSQAPSPRADLDAVLTRLAQQPVTTWITDPSTGMRAELPLGRESFVEALRVMMYSSSTAREIPRMVRQAAAGNYEPFATQAVVSLRGLRDGLRHGLLMSVVCAEDVARISESEIPALTQGTFFGDTRVRSQLAACAVWPKGDIPADYGNEVVSSVPSLVVSGRFDPVTPPKWGEMTVAGLANGRHIVTNGAHSPGSACLSAVIGAFIRSADARTLDVSCVTTVGMAARPRR